MYFLARHWCSAVNYWPRSGRSPVVPNTGTLELTNCYFEVCISSPSSVCAFRLPSRGKGTRGVLAAGERRGSNAIFNSILESTNISLIRRFAMSRRWLPNSRDVQSSRVSSYARVHVCPRAGGYTRFGIDDLHILL